MSILPIICMVCSELVPLGRGCGPPRAWTTARCPLTIAPSRIAAFQARLAGRERMHDAVSSTADAVLEACPEQFARKQGR